MTRKTNYPTLAAARDDGWLTIDDSRAYYRSLFGFDGRAHRLIHSHGDTEYGHDIYVGYHPDGSRYGIGYMVYIKDLNGLVLMCHREDLQARLDAISEAAL